MPPPMAAGRYMQSLELMRLTSQPEQSEVPEQHVLGNGDDLGRHEDQL